jgi:hypothetical protein
MTVVKKTVALYPEMDWLIRTVWARLIENGYDASYSTALHFMLVKGLYSMLKEGGLSEEEAWKYIRGFMSSEKMEELNIEDAITKLTESIIRSILKKAVK